jgi:hypothetical protein
MTPVEAAQILVDEEFTGWQVVTFGAIGMAESGLDPYALHRVVKPGSPAHLSIDHGWLQINDYWQATMLHLNDVHVVSQYLADPHNCAWVARHIYLEAGGGVKGYNLWNTYRSGAYRPYVPDAREAAHTVGIKV